MTKIKNLSPEEAKARKTLSKKYQVLSKPQLDAVAQGKISYQKLLYDIDRAYESYVKHWNENKYTIRNRGTKKEPNYDPFDTIEFGQAYASLKEAGFKSGLGKRLAEQQHYKRKNVTGALRAFKKVLSEIKTRVSLNKAYERVGKLDKIQPLTPDEAQFFQLYGHMTQKQITEEFVRDNYNTIVPLLKRILGYDEYKRIVSPKEEEEN